MSSSVPQLSDAAPCRIPLSQGRSCIVDAADLLRLSALSWCWCAGKPGAIGYAAHYDYDSATGLITMTYLHRLLMDAPTGMQVDHINGDTLDNRRSNLRLCSNAQNQQNRRRASNNTSGYKGVSWHKQKRKWHAYITLDGKRRSLGLHATAEDAARAYNRAAQTMYGAFARLNVLPDQSEQASGAHDAIA